MNRRTVVGLLATTAVIAAGGTGAYVLTRKPTTALEPWKTAGLPDDRRLSALSYAILAPNPHNRQPWIFELDGDDTVRVYCDLDRRLPETDPFDRQIVIGFGCALELLRMAAAEAGTATEIDVFPEGEPVPRLDERPIAHVRFAAKPDTARDPLFAEITHRRTNREPYDTSRPVPPKVADALVQAAEHAPARITVDTDRVARLRDLTWRAHVREVETPRTWQESVDVMRIGHAEVDRTPDGIALTGPFPEALRLAGVLDHESLADPESTAYAQGLEMFRDVMGTAMGYVWLETGGGRAAEIDAGRAWVRVNLAAAAQGLSLQPVSQALQEYPEMADLHEEVYGELGVEEPRRLQMLGRFGYGPEIGPSPRWPLESRVKESG